nr:3-dehydroquinate synthase [Oceanococcus sp. HetDA_MAG_MS8]
MKPVRLDVNIPGRHYPIHIGQGLIGQADLLPHQARAQSTVIISNATIAQHYLAPLKSTWSEPVLHFLIEDGEAFKTLDTAAALIDFLLEHKLGRDTTLIALGGGVVGDLCGFVAAIYQRGISFIQVPTTLLAQVDSSVGGKTAVNRPAGKNMVGAFHQPQVVIADLATLDTLPQRELQAGLAEVIKYGLIGDANFFAWLENNIEGLLERDPKLLLEAVYNSCAHKARVVARDEREAGQRALLNLGHTFGHAIEAHLQYKGWLHGEAVGCGMLMAADCSARQGWLDADAVHRIARLLERAGLPLAPPAGLSAASMLNFMRGDKKNVDGQIRLVLFDGIGQTRVSSDYDAAALGATLQAFCTTD